MTTAQTIIDTVRLEALNDSAKDRFSDSRLLGYLNEALQEIAARRPDLFSTQGVVATVAGIYQTAPTDSLRLMDVLQVQNGRSIRETDQELLDTLNPNWRIAAGASTKNWMRYRKDPNRFMISPPAPAISLNLVVLYGKVPTVLALGDTFQLVDTYVPAAKHFMVFKTEMPADESILNGRASLMFNAFEKSLAASVASKSMVDDENNRRDQRAKRSVG